jgi:DNA replication protein DnaC
VLKTPEDFQWNWPRKINRSQIQNLFRLTFIATHTNVILIGNVCLGKTHLSIALGHVPRAFLRKGIPMNRGL